MRIYLAGPWKHREAAREAARKLQVAGHTITSRWLWEHGDTTNPVILRREAQHDLDDILESDVMVLLNIELSEGKAFEQGFAKAHEIPVIGVGPISHIFGHLHSYLWVETIEDALIPLNIYF